MTDQSHGWNLQNLKNNGRCRRGWKMQKNRDVQGNSRSMTQSFGNFSVTRGIFGANQSKLVS